MCSMRAVLGIVISVALLGCVTVRAGGAREPARTSVPAPKQFVPFEQTTLPYSGFGRVTILDDGTLLIRAGGSPSRDPSDDAGPVPAETIAYQLDTTDLSIVFHHKDVFLDRGGHRVAELGLDAHQLRTMSFADPLTLDARSSREAILSHQGELQLRLDSTTQTLDVTSRDSESTDHTLRLSLRIRVAGDAKGGSSGDEVDRQGGVKGQENSVVATVSPHESAASCSASCPRGACNITCDRGRKAYCHNGSPVCECTGSLAQ